MPSITNHSAPSRPFPSSSTISTAHENEIRQRFVLVQHDTDQAALVVLLRFAGVEPSTTRAKLRELGFGPTASPESASVSWRRRVTTEEVVSVCAQLHDAFGDTVLFDLGSAFAETARTSLRRARETTWPARFLVHVGGTRRCVLFDGRAQEADLERACAEARGDYFEHEFHASTE